MAIFSQQKLNQLQAADQAVAPRYAVMIVDDKEANLSVMAAVLRPHYQVIEARDGVEALGLIEGLSQPATLACIISDHRMPRMTGVELLARVQPLLPQAARIIVSGYIDVDAVVEAVNRAEVYKFIVKPFDAADFLQAVQGAVERFEMQQQFSARHAQLLQENQQLHERNQELEAGRKR